MGRRQPGLPHPVKRVCNAEARHQSRHPEDQPIRYGKVHDHCTARFQVIRKDVRHPAHVGKMFKNIVECDCVKPCSLWHGVREQACNHVMSGRSGTTFHLKVWLDAYASYPTRCRNLQEPAMGATDIEQPRTTRQKVRAFGQQLLKI